MRLKLSQYGEFIAKHILIGRKHFSKKGQYILNITLFTDDHNTCDFFTGDFVPSEDSLRSYLVRKIIKKLVRNAYMCLHFGLHAACTKTKFMGLSDSLIEILNGSQIIVF